MICPIGFLKTEAASFTNLAGAILSLTYWHEKLIVIKQQRREVSMSVYVLTISTLIAGSRFIVGQ